MDNVLNLNSWYKPKETFSGIPTEVFSGGQMSGLEQQLQVVAPSLGISLPAQQQQFAPAGLNSVTIPAFETQQAADKGMEKKSWNKWVDITSQEDISGLKMGPADSFCECSQSDPETMNTQCSLLTEYNCKRVGCCVFTSSNKCLAGNETGATFSNAPMDYYYYKNKCYGDKCPPKKKC